MKLLWLSILFLTLAACRYPNRKVDETLPTGTRIGHNSLTGTIVKFEDGNVVCYASRRGLSCLKR